MIMVEEEILYRSLRLPHRPQGKLVLLVLDGVGDIATAATGYRTPLEAAVTPNLDELAQASAMGRITPLLPGITPGSGPGHLGLFGYDPAVFRVDRGVIEALGLGMDLRTDDVAARANFCTVSADGVVTDRRAGRIDSGLNRVLCKKLGAIGRIGETEVIVRHGRSHRFVLVFRGGEIAGPLPDSDPHGTGLPIRPIVAENQDDKVRRAAEVIAEFYRQAMPLLAEDFPANGFLLRGIGSLPRIPGFEERFQLEAAAIAVYPMYRGLAQLIGMRNLERVREIRQQFQQYLDEFQHFDYFFIHVKGTDMAGEDGDFEGKVAVIEALDRALPTLLQKRPLALAITGDHSTPVALKSHSWHPQPVLLNSPVSGSDKLSRFTETCANRGSLGLFQSKYLIRLMMANAGLYGKFGA